MSNNIPWYIALASFILAAALYFCWLPNHCVPCGSGKVVSHEVDSTGIDTVYRTIMRTDSVPVVRWKSRTHTDTVKKSDTVPRDVDTSAIVADYLRTRFYKDTVGDSTMRAIIADSVRANRIVDRKVAMKNLRSTQIDKRTIVEPKPRKANILAGAFLHNAGQAEQPLRVGPQVMVSTNKGHVIGLGTDLVGEQPNVMLSVSFKLFSDTTSIW